jgi:hypothetical protein
MILTAANVLIPSMHLNYYLRKEGHPVCSLFNQVVQANFLDIFWLMLESRPYDPIVFIYEQRQATSTQAALRDLETIRNILLELGKSRKAPKIIFCFAPPLEQTAKIWYLYGVEHFVDINDLTKVVDCVNGTCLCHQLLLKTHTA